MLGLKDFFHMPQIDTLVQQLATDQPGLIVVAGLESRRDPVDEVTTHLFMSGKSAILRILMREILSANPRDHCTIFTDQTDPFRIPRELRSRCELVQPRQAELRLRRLRDAINRRPGLLILDQLTAETAALAVDAAKNGIRVLTQVTTIFRGSAVARYLQTMGLTREDLNQLTWVVSVMRQPVLCPACKQAVQLDAPSLERLGMDSLDPGQQFYRSQGCQQCKHTGRQGEVTVFDVFRADHQQPDLYFQSSILPAKEYLLHLVKAGQLAPEDALELDAKLLHETYAMLEAEEKALVEANQTLQRKVLELEVSNRLLVQRTEAMISFQEIGQTLINSTSLVDLANRISRYTRDLCGADRSVVYFQRSESELQVLACEGWNDAVIEASIPASVFPQVQPGEEMRRYWRVPPGVNVSAERTMPARTGFYVPLIADGRTVGRMVLQATQKREFSPGEVSMLRIFANQAALAMQRAELIDQLRAKIAELEAAQVELVQKERLEHELELARQVQQNVLPRNFPVVAGVDFAAFNLPARQVGGDFFDVIRLENDCLGVVIADVSDKGMPAALYMALARSLILAEAHRESSPRNVLANVNRLLMELGEPGMFVTVFYGVIDCAEKMLVYARAGHDLPLLLRDGDMIRLGGDGVALGVVDGDEFHLAEAEIALQSGDWLLLFTDGLIDAQGQSGARFGLDRLVDFWRRGAFRSVEDLCAMTFDHISTFQAGAEQSDDMTLLVVRFRGD